MRSQLFTTCNIVSIICGLFMIFSSIGVYLVSNAIINYNIHKNVMIQEDSPAYKFWLNPPASIYRKYYLFHVENPSEIEKGETPILKERGPYTYREVWEKRHIEFLGHEALRFTPVITLFFERNMSIGDESDLITFLNVPAISMIEVASKMQSKEFVPAMVDDLLRLFNTKLFLTKTVGELISGYQDPLMALAKLFLPEVIKDDKFSLINGKNGTEWQNYSINTGYDYASEVAKIITWDGKEKLDYWNTPNANLINGTDGTFYSPFRTKDQRLYAFSPDMCRSYSLTYLKDNEIDGIKTMDFHLPRTMFYNASYNPDNEGFCDGNCLGNGVLNISQCYGGASGFISQPHFLNAEKQFTDALEGMAPDENKHDFVLHFEPTTGVPISGNIRLMISFYMFQNEKIELVKNVKPVLFPMVWFDDDLHLDRDTRNQLAQVALYVNISFYSPIVMASVGVLTLMIHFTIVAVRWLRSKKSSSPPNENTSLINPNINSEE